MNYNPYKLIDFLRESGIKLSQTASSWVTDCPRCQKQNKLYFYKNGGRFVCWVCESSGFSGSAEYALSEILGEEPEVIKNKLIDNEFDSSFELVVKNAPENEEIEYIQESYVWPGNFYPLSHEFSIKGIEYLAKRGVPLDIAHQYGIRYCPLNRTIVFPVEEDGTLFGWQERIIYQDFFIKNGEKVFIPKAKTAQAFKKAEFLMFMDRLKNSEHAILTEGPFDAIKAHLCGGNVCSMGKKVSRSQMDIFVKYKIKKLYIGLDPDAAEEVQKMVHDYYGQFELYNMVPKIGDLGEMSFEDVFNLYQSAPKIGPGSLFFFLK